MARECMNIPRQSPHGREASFDARILCNEPRDDGQIEMMDCSIGKTGGEKPKDKPKIWVRVGGRKMQAIVDTGCTETLVRADLALRDWALRVDAVKMISVHGQPAVYHRRSIGCKY